MRSRFLVPGLLAALALSACNSSRQPQATGGLRLSALPAPPTSAASVPTTLGFTVTNTGTRPRNGVTLKTVLDVPSDAVALSVPAGAQGNALQGFGVRLDLAPGQRRTVRFQAQASEAGVYCMAATVTEGGELSALLSPVPASADTVLAAQSCFTVEAAQ